MKTQQKAESMSRGGDVDKLFQASEAKSARDNPQGLFCPFHPCKIGRTPTQYALLRPTGSLEVPTL